MVKPNKEKGNKKTVKIIEKNNLKLSHKFIYALSLVSIVGFVGVVSESLFSFDIVFYVEAFLMLIIGVGIVERYQKYAAEPAKMIAVMMKTTATIVPNFILFLTHPLF
jgi:positive regulator of sigma E activity